MSNMRLQPYEIIVPPMPRVLHELLASHGSMSWACSNGQTLEEEDIVASFNFRWKSEIRKSLSPSTADMTLSGAVLCPIEGIITRLGAPAKSDFFFCLQPMITEDWEQILAEDAKRMEAYLSGLANPRRIYKHTADTAHLLVKYHQNGKGPSDYELWEEIDNQECQIRPH